MVELSGGSNLHLLAEGTIDLLENCDVLLQVAQCPREDEENADSQEEHKTGSSEENSEEDWVLVFSLHCLLPEDMSTVIDT